MHASVRGFVASVAVFSLAACSDSTTSLRQIAPHAPSAPAFDFSATGSALGWFRVRLCGWSTAAARSRSAVSTRSTSRQTRFAIRAVSTYGPTRMGQELRRARATARSIKVHATLSLDVRRARSRLHAGAAFFADNQGDDFDRHLRVVHPIANQDYFQTHPNALNAFAILYSPGLGVQGVSAISRPTEASSTHVDLNTGLIWRRVKHFSGYSIVSGESCDPSPDNPDCVEIDGDANG